jgi:formylglycine-generating enzyme required for sulfatase activity
LRDDIARCPVDGSKTVASIRGEPVLDGRYQLEKRLGSGGMGLVFKARHVFLKTPHAIKIILPDLVGNDSNLLTRFHQEALAAAAIRHQNIITVTDFGVLEGSTPFLVMEFVEGKSLYEIITEEGAMPPLRAFDLFVPICAGIAAAHRQGIVHRDLKPLNIMVQNGVPVSEGVKILDFGLAKIKSGELLGSFVVAKTTALLGSPFYMAPEQWSDEEADSRADIYSLGVMLYQMLCGEVPFNGKSIPSIMNKHLTQPAPSFASMGIEVAPEIEAAIHHALEKDRNKRTSTAEAFIAELRAAIEGAGAAPDRTANLRIVESKATKPLASPAAGQIPETIPLAGSFGRKLLEQPGERRERTIPLQGKFIHAEHVQTGEAQSTQSSAEVEPAPIEKAPEKVEEKVQTPEPRFTTPLEHEISQALPPAAETRALSDAGSLISQATPKSTSAETQRFVRTVPRSFPQLEIEPPPRARKKLVALVSSLFVVLVIAVGIVGYYALRPIKVRPAKVTGPPAVKEPAVTQTMVEIHGGTFQMGRDDGPSTEGPAHSVTVSSFFMDKNEVTNAEYEQFVRETNHATPELWRGNTVPAEDERRPVSDVSYEDAVAFSEWRSKRDGIAYRLPTEEEWEYAARNGDQNNLYPWGNSWISGRAATEETGVKVAQPVGTYPQGDDIWGVEDLVGNVWEWTTSKASLYNPSSSLPLQHQNWMVIRGGCYASPTKGLLPVSGTLRNWVAPTYKNPVLGFRLVRPGA